jgi:hypothetical protein
MLKYLSKSILNKNKMKFSTRKAIEIIDNLKKKAGEATANRASRFKKNMRFALDKKQWENDEEDNIANPKLIFNQTKDYIDIHVSKIFPINPKKGTFEIGVTSFEENKEKKEKYEKEILETYAENLFEITINEQLLNFFYGGDACIYYPQNEITKKAEIISLDPKRVFLNWEGGKLIQFAFKDSVSIDQGRMELKARDNWIVNFVKKALGTSGEDTTDAFKEVERITYWDKNFKIIKIGENEVKIFPNQNKIIPASWIPNEPKPNEQEGKSDVEKLKQLEKEYNARTSDLGERVFKNTTPVLATYSDNKIEIGDKRDGHLQLSKGDKAEFLTVPEASENMKYVEKLEERMQTKMGINDAILGRMRSNISALAMGYYFSPLNDRIAKKRIYWDKALKELNRAILKYRFGEGDFRTEATYHQAMLLDQNEQVRNTIQMLNNRLISHVDAIDELRNVENSEEKMRAIIEEIKTLSKVDGFLSEVKEESNKNKEEDEEEEKV